METGERGDWGSPGEAEPGYAPLQPGSDTPTLNPESVSTEREREREGEGEGERERESERWGERERGE